jgi:hypothetical protein
MPFSPTRNRKAVNPALLLCALILARGAPAQQPPGTNGAGHHHAVVKSTGGKQTLPGGVDGSVTPQLIPDTVAYRMFFQLMSEPANATPHELARQRANLAPAKLSSADLAVVFQVLAGFRVNLLAIQQAFSNAWNAAGQSNAAFDGTPFSNQRDELTQATVASLQAQLSPDGMTRLKAYVQAEKKNMTIFPLPNMTGGGK